MSYLELLLHFENKGLDQLMEAPQEILVPNEEFIRQMEGFNTEIAKIKAKIHEIEDKKKE